MLKLIIAAGVLTLMSLQGYNGSGQGYRAAPGSSAELPVPYVGFDARDVNGNGDGNAGWFSYTFPHASTDDWESNLGISMHMDGPTSSTGRYYLDDCGDGLPCFESVDGASSGYLQTDEIRSTWAPIHSGPSSYHVLFKEYEFPDTVLAGALVASSTFTSSSTGVVMSHDRRVARNFCLITRYPDFIATMTPALPTVDVWHLASIEFDDTTLGSPETRYYVDGVLVDSTPIQDSATYLGYGASSTLFMRFGNANSATSFQGDHRIVLFYDDASGTHSKVYAWMQAEGLLP